MEELDFTVNLSYEQIKVILDSQDMICILKSTIVEDIEFELRLLIKKVPE